MRRVLVAFLVVVGSTMTLWLAATGIAGGSNSIAQAQYGGPSHGSGPVQDTVYGGGRYGDATTDGTPFFVTLREFSIDAHASPSGGGAYGTVTIGNPATGSRFITGDVMCLDVEGNAAAIGGFVRESVDPGAVGKAFFVFFKDGGLAGSGTLDRGAPFFVDEPNAPGLPEAFPQRCSLVDTNAFGYGHVSFVAGDVVIHDE